MQCKSMNLFGRVTDLLAISLVALLLIITTNSGLMAAENVPRISVQELKRMLGNSDLIIMDVRKTRSWWRSNTKILGAIREDISKPADVFDKYPKDKMLVFYCS